MESQFQPFESRIKELEFKLEKTEQLLGCETNNNRKFMTDLEAQHRKERKRFDVELKAAVDKEKQKSARHYENLKKTTDRSYKDLMYQADRQNSQLSDKLAQLKQANESMKATYEGQIESLARKEAAAEGKRRMKEQKGGATNDHIAEIDRLSAQVAKQDQQVAALTQSKDLERVVLLRDIRTTHEKDVAKLKENHEQAISRLKNEHASQLASKGLAIQSLTADYEKRLETSRANYESLDSKYSDDLASLKTQLDDKIRGKDQELSLVFTLISLFSECSF